MADIVASGSATLTIEQPWAISSLGMRMHLGSLSVIQKEESEVIAEVGGRRYSFHISEYAFGSADEIETLLVQAKQVFDGA